MSHELWYDERLLIDGRLTAATGGATFDNVNPATEEVIGVAADGTPADMDAAIGAARRAFDDTTWSTDIDFRVRCLRQLQEAFVRHAEEIRPTVVAEVGCPVSLTSGPQLDTPVEGIGWVTDLLEGYEWEQDLGIASPFGMREPPVRATRGDRGRRGHHAVELPAPDQPREGRARARRGQHGGAEAGARHAVVRLDPGRAWRPRRPTSRPGCSTS